MVTRKSWTYIYALASRISTISRRLTKDRMASLRYKLSGLLTLNVEFLYFSSFINVQHMHKQSQTDVFCIATANYMFFLQGYKFSVRFLIGQFPGKSRICPVYRLIAIYPLSSIISAPCFVIRN